MNMEAADASNEQSIMLAQDDSVWATGSNHDGQLGDGSTVSKSSFVQVVSNGAQTVAAGGLHSMVLERDGSFRATGANEYGQLEDGTAISRHAFPRVMQSSDGSCLFLDSALICADGFATMSSQPPKHIQADCLRSCIGTCMFTM